MTSNFLKEIFLKLIRMFVKTRAFVIKNRSVSYASHTKFINDIDGESRQIWKCIGTPINGPVVAHETCSRFTEVIII